MRRFGDPVSDDQPKSLVGSNPTAGTTVRYGCRFAEYLSRFGMSNVLWYRTKVLYAAVGSTVKNVFDHVIRRLNALSVGLKWVQLCGDDCHGRFVALRGFHLLAGRGVDLTRVTKFKSCAAHLSNSIISI